MAQGPTTQEVTPMPSITLHADVPEVEQTELRTRSNERDEFQQKIDTDVRDLAVKWERLGRLAPGEKKAPYLRYVVGKADRAGIKNVIRRSVRLFVIDTAGKLNIREDIAADERMLDIDPIFFKDVLAKDKSGLYQVKFNLAVHAKENGNGSAEAASTPANTETKTK